MEYPENNMSGEPKESNGVGGFIGIIIIIIVLLAGAWYFLSERVTKLEQQNAPVIEESQMSTSTEVSDIEADLGKINVDSLDN